MPQPAAADIAQDAFIAYRNNGTCSGSTSTNCPHVRFYDNAADTFGSAIVLETAGSGVRGIMARASPVEAKLVVVALSADGTLDSYVCVKANCGTASNWVVNHDFADVWSAEPATANRPFDLQFERVSGDLIILYDKVSTTSGQELFTRTMTAGLTNTAFGGETAVDTQTANAASDIVYPFVRMAQNFTGGDKLGAVFYDTTNDDVHAAIWSGSAWGNNAEVTNAATATDEEKIGIAFERNSGHMLVVGGAGAQVVYREFTTSWQTAANVGGVAANVGNVDWISMKPTPRSAGNEIYLGMVGADSDFATIQWSGTAWGTGTEHDAAVDGHASRVFDIAMSADADGDGATVDALLMWGTATNNISYRSWSASNTYGTASSISNSGTHPWVQFAQIPNPTTGDDVDNLGGTLDSASDISRLQWTGGTNAPTDVDDEVSSDTTVTTFEAYSIEFIQIEMQSQALPETITSTPGWRGNSTTSDADAQVAGVSYRSNSGVSGLLTPKYREWAPATRTWSSEVELPSVGENVRHTQLLFSPLTTKRVVLTMDSDGDIDLSYCTTTCTSAGSWTGPVSVVANALAPTDATARKHVGAAFEKTTGHLMIMYDKTGTSEDNDVYYKRLFANNTLSSESGFNPVGTADTELVPYIKLASNMTAGSNQIAIIFQNQASLDTYAVIWNGTGFEDSLELVATVSTTSMEAENIGIAYEGTNTGIIAFSAQASEVAAWARYTAGAWGPIATGDPNPFAVGNDGMFMTIKADPASSKVLICQSDDLNDLTCAQSDGSTTLTSWVRLTDATGTSTGRPFDIAWYKSGSQAIAVYETSGVADTTLSYDMWNGAAWTGQAGTYTVFSNVYKWIVLEGNPNANDKTEALGTELGAGSLDYATLVYNGGTPTVVSDSGFTTDAGAADYDSLSISWALVNGLSKDVTGDSITSADTRSMGVGAVMAAESITLTDAVSLVAAFLIQLNDAMSMADTRSSSFSSRRDGETITLSDNVDTDFEAGGQEFSQPLDDTIDLEDTVTKVIFVNLAESTLDLEDNVSTSVTLVIVETISISDNVNTSLTQNLDDSMDLEDTVTKSIGLNLQEAIDLNDTVTKTVGLIMAESLSSTDNRSSTVTIVLSDSVVMSDNISIILVLFIQLNENLSLLDTRTMSVSSRRDDTVTLSDNISNQLSFLVNVNESINLVDARSSSFTKVLYIDRQWVASFGTTEQDYGYAVATSIDAVYVAGDTIGDLEGANIGERDAFIRKLDNSGNVIWTDQFGTTVFDGVFGIAVNGSDIYVVGDTAGDLSSPNAGSDDGFLRKYDSSGNVIWTRQFGTANQEQLEGIMLDSTGGIYVIGNTAGDLEGSNLGQTDVFIRKYDSNGNALWTDQFGTTSSDVSYYGAADDTGVYVAGYTRGDLEGTNAGVYDIFLRKYGFDGNVIWTRQFGSDQYDYGNAVSVDGVGIYVAGATEGDIAGSAGERDIIVRKYDRDGNTLWTRQLGTAGFDHANAVASDRSGVYITGASNGAFGGAQQGGDGDMIIVKLDPNGNELYRDQYGTSEYDDGYDVAIGPSGVYITGETADPDNDVLFLKYGIDTITLTDDVDTFFESGGQNFTTIRNETMSFSDGRKSDVIKDFPYRPTWTLQFGTSGGTQVAYNTAVDTVGGVYVVGYTGGDLGGGNLGSTDVFIRKYNTTDFTVIWTRQFGTYTYDAGLGIAADAGGVYVVGETLGDINATNAGSTDAFIRKYSLDGTLVWGHQFGTTVGDNLVGVAVNDTRVYVMGTTSGDIEGVSAGQLDVFVRAYDSDGNILWTDQFGTNSPDSSFAAPVVNGDGLYVGGATSGNLAASPAGGEDAFLRKYDQDGGVIWTVQYGESGEDDINSISTDGIDIYVVGNTDGDLWGQGNFGGKDAYVRKYNPDSTVEWTRQVGTPNLETGLQSAADGTGVYVGGEVTDYALEGAPEEAPFGGLDLFVRKYTADGDVIWTDQYGTSEFDEVNGKFVVFDGVLYVGGDTQGGLAGPLIGSQDVFLRAYTPSPDMISLADAVAFLTGSLFNQPLYETLSLAAAGGPKLDWHFTFGVDDSHEVGLGIAADTQGDIYTVGNTNGDLDITNLGIIDAFIRKYDPDKNMIWSNQFGTDDYDSALAVATDLDDNVYVVGQVYGDLAGVIGSGDVFIRKYNSTGSVLWTDQFGTPNYDEARGVATDGVGGIYIVGLTTGNLSGTLTGTSDAFIRKYNSTGSVLWTEQIGYVDESSALYGITANAEGSFSTGTRFSISNTNATTYSFDPDGNQIWYDEFGTADFDDRAVAISMDDSAIYVAGETRGDLAAPNAGSSDIVLRKYLYNGTVEWTVQYGTESYDALTGVVVNSHGVFATGEEDGDLLYTQASNYGDGLFVMYSTDGELQYADQFGNHTDVYESGYAITSFGDYVYLTGEDDDDLTSFADAFIRRYSFIDSPYFDVFKSLADTVTLTDLQDMVNAGYHFFVNLSDFIQMVQSGFLEGIDNPEGGADDDDCDFPIFDTGLCI